MRLRYAHVYIGGLIAIYLLQTKIVDKGWKSMKKGDKKIHGMIVGR